MVLLWAKAVFFNVTIIMASRSASEKKNGGTLGIKRGLKEETVQGILAVALFVIGIFFVLAGIDMAGKLGTYTYSGVSYLLGVGYFIAPTLCLLLAAAFVSTIRERFGIMRIFGAVFFFVSALGLVDLLLKGRGGLLGGIISSPLLSLLDFYASVIILIALLFIALLVIFDTPLAHLFVLGKALFPSREKKLKEPRIVNGVDDESRELLSPKEREDVEATDEEASDDKEVKKNEVPEKKKKDIKITPDENGILSDAEGSGFAAMQVSLFSEPWTLPPLSLLERDSGKPGSGDIKGNANIIKRCLQNFGIDVEMDEVTIGPSVTRYALKPAEGVKLSRISALQDNLSLALAAHPLRIEAPIPGKSLVGIEIPNKTKATVGLGSLLSNDEYQASQKPLMVALGKGISGKVQFANLAKMPHLLIAGATGSGKSVTIHAIINSLLFRNSPENMRMIMIDPKRVELTLYNGIAHLLAPVITDPKKTIAALRWAAKEMDRRYDVLEKNHVRDIESYQKNVLAPAIESARQSGMTEEEAIEKLPPSMPYIVIVVDELADIMATYPRELEAAIVRLAQMSRAVGIHLILSTQRPSVNVITGLIKANVPARVALQVASQIDSRTILDTMGAEKLLGAGDLLYLSADIGKPVRLQSAFISEREVKEVVSHIKKIGADRVPTEINFLQAIEDKNSISEASFDDREEDEDDLYEEARSVVISTRKASTSFLQRKLGVGYSRAARLIDILEERGVIGAGQGAKPRDVLIESTNPDNLSPLSELDTDEEALESIPPETLDDETSRP